MQASCGVISFRYGHSEPAFLTKGLHRISRIVLTQERIVFTREQKIADGIYCH